MIIGLAVLLLCSALAADVSSHCFDVLSRAASEIECTRSLLGVKSELALRVLLTNVAVSATSTECCAYDTLHVAILAVVVLFAGSFLLEVQGCLVWSNLPCGLSNLFLHRA